MPSHDTLKPSSFGLASIFMDNRDPRFSELDGVREAVRAFYDRHPYPPPAGDLAGYRRRWRDEARRRADFHLHWPGKAYRTDLQVLVAGCGTSQAAKHALRQPASRVVGIDVGATSTHHTAALKHKYTLTNLEVHQLPVERVGELGRRFDKIVCTGVLHHLPVPEEGLRALREVLQPDGAMHLMVYATYGRAGVYMLQEYCRRLGVGHTDKEIRDLAVTLTALPYRHPLAHLLGESPDFRHRDALADALLNPQDRAYTVPQLFDLIDGCGLTFGRWVRQAPYLARCGRLAATSHAARLAGLPTREQYAAVELLRGTMVRHNVIVYRSDRPVSGQPIRFDEDGWQHYVPIRLPRTRCVEKRLPPGAAAVLINQGHTYTDLVLPIDEGQRQLFEGIDGHRTITEIQNDITSQGEQSPSHELARSFFEQLWCYDQVVFDTTRCSKESDGGA
ncbi:MAG: class I SAM-dependent methyltransferase [Desulfobacterales bacterium]